MKDQEKIFAKALLDPAVPALKTRSLPPSGADAPTTRLILTGLFIELVTLESPSSLQQFGSKFELKLALCEEPVSARSDKFRV
jgi:hypothetical protein